MRILYVCAFVREREEGGRERERERMKEKVRKRAKKKSL